MAQRIKGQDVEVLLIVDSQIIRSITAVKSFEMKAQLEMLDEGYLGEKTNRKDSIYKGVSATIELNFDSPDIFDLFDKVIQKAKRRTPGTKINVKATLNFPNGVRKRVLIPDCEFGELPMSFGSRSDFGSVSLDLSASDYTTI